VLTAYLQKIYDIDAKVQTAAGTIANLMTTKGKIKSDIGADSTTRRAGLANKKEVKQ